MIRDVFLEYDKVYMVILLYIGCKMSYFRHILGNAHKVQFFLNVPSSNKTVEKLYSPLSGHGSTIYDPKITQAS